MVDFVLARARQLEISTSANVNLSQHDNANDRDWAIQTLAKANFALKNGNGNGKYRTRTLIEGSLLVPRKAFQGKTGIILSFDVHDTEAEIPLVRAAKEKVFTSFDLDLIIKLISKDFKTSIAREPEPEPKELEESWEKHYEEGGAWS